MRIVVLTCSVACSFACILASSSTLSDVYPCLRAAPEESSSPMPQRLRTRARLHVDAEYVTRSFRTFP